MAPKQEKIQPESTSTIAKVIAVSLEIPYLGKTESNKYQGYSYVSIDAFYDVVASAALKRGLTWSMREISMKAHDADRWSFTYAFTLHDVDGHDIENIDQVTIVHPWQGAQTSGSSRSYAEKIFMRSLFKVRTGEPDADASNQDDRRQSPIDNWQQPVATEPTRTLTETWNIGEPDAPLPARQDFGELVDEYKDGYPVLAVPKPNDVAVHQWDLVTNCFETFVNLSESAEELQQFWTDNYKIIDMMKARAQNDYERVKGAFKKRGDQLTPVANQRKV